MADPLKAEDVSSGPILTPTSSEPPILPGTPPAFGELPPARNRFSYTAGSLGNSVGGAVRRMRRLPVQLRIVGGRSSRKPIVESAPGTVDELKEAAQEHLDDWRDSSRRAIYQFRRRAQEIRNEYPLHTVLAFGAVGFLVGATLRVWRSR
jgi:hypothetical protein